MTTAPTNHSLSRRQPFILQEKAIPFAVFFFFLGFYLFTGHGIISSPDGIFNFLTVRSLVETHSFSLGVDCEINQQFAQLGEDGGCYSKYDVGLALTSVPLYWIGRLISGSASAEYDVLSLPRLFVSTLNQFVTAVTCAIVYLIALYLTNSTRKSLELTFLFGLSTIAWPYATTYFSQPLIGLLLLTAFYQLLTKRGKLSVWLAGTALGWALLTRLDTLPLVCLIGLYAVYKLHLRETRWRDVAVHMSGFTVPIVLSAITILGLNQWRYGAFFYNSYANESWSGIIWQGVYGLLFSPGRGIIFYSPLVLLAFSGLFKLWRTELKPEIVLFVGLFTVQVVMYAAWWIWNGGWVWGPRFLVSTQPFLIFGLLPWLEKSRLKPLLIILIGLGFFIQLIGVTTSPLVYLTRTSSTYEQTLYNPVATPIWGQMQDMFNRRVTLLIPSQAHGVLSKGQTMIWIVFCFVLMLVSGNLLKREMSSSSESKIIGGKIKQ